MPRPRLHDSVRLVRDVGAAPAGSSGVIVIVYDEVGMLGVELDDPDLAPTLDGIVDVTPEDVELEEPRCPRCGSREIQVEMRDARFPAPPTAYGEWLVCAACTHEWQPTETSGTTTWPMGPPGFEPGTHGL